MGVLREKAIEKGYTMLRDDELFVRRSLDGLPSKRRRELLRRYFEIWDIGMAKTPVFAHRQNWGRKEANSWLRQYLNIDEKKDDPV